jgi:hypothetical protein
MRDFYKKANFYFIALPACLAIWVLIAGVTLPKAKTTLESQEKKYTDSQTHIDKILELEPQRLNRQKKTASSKKFDYGTVISQFAKEKGISPANKNYSVSKTRKKGKVSIQTANVTIKNVDIEKLTRFISSMLYVWPDLQCTNLSLKKQKSGRNTWDSTLKLSYTYRAQ